MAATNHSPTAEEVMAYLDREAPEADRARIDAHVAGCAECRSLIDDLRLVSRETASWSVGDPPATLQARQCRPTAPLTDSWFSRPWLVGLTAAAGLTLVAFALIPLAFRPSVVRTNASPVQLGDATAASAGRPQAKDEAPSFVARRGSRQLMNAPEGQANAPSGRDTVVERQRPMLIRTARVDLVTSSFESIRPAVERVVRDLGGFVDELTATGTLGITRSLRGTLRIPAARLDDAVARLRQLGQVVEDTQRSEDVTDQIVDLDARLANARATERRLSDILRDRTGRLSDVLEVEREITRVRLDIERLDAERTNLGRRVSYAVVTVNITEERKAGLDGPLSLRSRLRVALAEGIAAASESVVGTLLLALHAGPALIVWLAVAGLVWMGVRRIPRFGMRG